MSLWVANPGSSAITAALPLPAETALRRPRAVGELRVASKAAPGGSALEALRQAGAMKALFPRGTPDRVVAVALNTAGGITGGDRLALSARAGENSRLTVTTQAAERIYAAEPDETGEIANRLAIGAGARADWLPQETILYDRARLRRTLAVEMAEDATLLAVEALILGRKAMGETVRDAVLTDRLSVRRGGVPLFEDTLRLAGDASAVFARAACGGGAGAAATLLFAAPGAEAALEPLRRLLPATAGASLARPGLVVARFLAEDGFALRAGLVPILTLLNGSDLPRSWML